MAAAFERIFVAVIFKAFSVTGRRCMNVKNSERGNIAGSFVGRCGYETC